MKPTTVEEHYAQPDLVSSIKAALAKMGKDLEQLSPEDLAPVDEFHIRGRAATEELFDLAGFTPEMKVLDVGSGIGGPARFLASTRGCRVVGVDLTDEYCRVARQLSDLVGLSSKTEFHQGDALSMPFEAGSFDAVLMQHANMNIPDKQKLFGEVRRVIRPEGTFAVYEIAQGPRTPVHLPVPWASAPHHNHLATPEALNSTLVSGGWTLAHWEEVTDGAREWARSLKSRLTQVGPPPIGLHLILGPTATEKVRNLVANLEEERIRVVRGILRPA